MLSLVMSITMLSSVSAKEASIEYQGVWTDYAAKEYVAGDTGGAIGGSKIDIHFPSTTEALNWGRRTITIQIIT